VDIHSRALDYPQSDLDRVIPDEAELTAGVRVRPGRSYGFFTDTTLCIGCKACEVACKEWNNLPADSLGLTGQSYDNTGALSAYSWRHVNFIEHAVRLRWSRGLASALQIPASLTGAGLSTYTASLFSATSSPAWASTPKALAVRFGAASVASATAAMSMGEGHRQTGRDLDAITVAPLAVNSRARCNRMRGAARRHP
jgi:ferredoxin